MISIRVIYVNFSCQSTFIHFLQMEPVHAHLLWGNTESAVMPFQTFPCNLINNWSGISWAVMPVMLRIIALMSSPVSQDTPLPSAHCAVVSCFCSPWGQSGWRCVRDRCRFTRKQLPVSSKHATGWATPPLTPQTLAASAGAAAVAAPGKTPLLPLSLAAVPTLRGLTRNYGAPRTGGDSDPLFQFTLISKRPLLD